MDRQPIFLLLYNGVQEGDGPILLVVLHCKFYGRVNTVYVLEEALFIGLLVDNKGIIHIPAPEPGGQVQYIGLFALRTPCRGLLLWDLLGNPWPHPQPVQRTWPWKEK